MTRFLRPITIGGVRLPNNLVLSPMAGFTDLPFRILSRRHGAGLVCSEMVAAVAVERDAGKTLARMRTVESERPTSVQVFGTAPDEVARATRRVADACDIVGFNMGCPAARIQREGCGAALLDHPDRAEAIVRAMDRATEKPLLVKIRGGNGSRVDVAALARRLVDAGADALIVHGRTAAQGYSGTADWAIVRDVKDAVDVPVIANGDVVDGPSAEACLRESGAAGVAVGRAALGDPRVFHRIAQYLETGAVLPAPAPSERLHDFAEYVRVAEEVGLDLPHVLKQAQQFTRGLRGARELRQRFSGRGVRLADVRAALAQHVAALEADALSHAVA